jgi:hypothetical protein
MRALPLAAALLLPGIAAASAAGDAAFALRCERELKPSFEVTARETKFDVYNTVSSWVLNTRGTHANASQLMLGMTSTSPRSEILIDAPGLQDRRTALECVAPRISVDLSYSPLRVDVAREFRTSTCPYRVVYEHEMQHVQLYREQLPRIQRKVRAELERRYGSRPLFAPAGQGLARLESDVDTWLRPMIRAELDQVEQFQAALDTPEESARLSHACFGEVAAAVGSSF